MLQVHPDRLPTVEYLQSQLLLFLARGYASDDPSSQLKIEAHPVVFGWKIIRAHVPYAELCMLTFTDEWGSDGGMTSIKICTTNISSDVTLWTMSYLPSWEGAYPEEMIPALKSSLLLGYQSKKFHGGRGPQRCCPAKNILYENNWKGVFSRFDGRESLSKETDGQYKIQGAYQYWGGTTFPLLRR